MLPRQQEREGDMAVEVDSPPVVSTRRLEGSLVAPPTLLPVPNHLTAISESPHKPCTPSETNCT